MFQWINCWRQRRRKRRQAAEEARRLEGRAIFDYWDGQRWRYADPMVIWEQILNGPVDVINQMQACLELRQPAAIEVPARLREIFGVEPFDPETKTGLTGWEMIKLYELFAIWVDRVKKNGSPGPTSSAPSEPTPSTGSAPRSEVTSASSDSGSIPPESTPVAASTS